MTAADRPDRNIIVVDVETNGLDPITHQAVEVAWWNLTTGDRGHFVPPHSPSLVLGLAEVEALRINRYLERIPGQPQDDNQNELAWLHDQFRTWPDDDGEVVRHTLAGANPRFDALMVAKLFDRGDPDRFDEPTPWHHRLWDIEAYAAGVLGLGYLPGLREVCQLVGAPEPDHTAAGDVTAAGACFQALRLRAELRAADAGGAR